MLITACTSRSPSMISLSASLAATWSALELNIADRISAAKVRNISWTALRESSEWPIPST